MPSTWNFRASFGDEVVEHVRRVAEAGEQDDGGAAPAPIEHFEPHVRLDFDPGDRVRRDVPERHPREGEHHEGKDQAESHAHVRSSVPSLAGA
jgi:hypothetical protein